MKAQPRQLTHGSLFAGIGGFDEGFHRAGFKCWWQVEKEPFCIAVLKTRFPNTERYYDVLKCGHDRIHKLRAVDVVTAGFPCQDLSVAGKRAGLAGSRSGLFWEVVRILREFKESGRPIPWFVLENVPGLFSSGGGRDFGIVLEALDELWYGVAWRVLNSQFFGVAQRRRRVFIVGRFGKPCPAEVLFESEGGGGNIATGGEARPELAYEIAASLKGVGGSPRGFNLDAEQGLAVFHGTSQHAIASLSGMGSGGPDDNDGQAGRIVSSSADSHGMRDFAELPKGLDSARYRALGNAVTVSVAQWIGQRIKAVIESE